MNKMNKPQQPRNHGVYARLFKVDRERAEAYRLETLGLTPETASKPVEVASGSVVTEPKQDKKPEPTQTKVESTKDTEKLLKNEYKKLLKAADIKFHFALGLDKLKVLCQENKLID